MASPDPFPVGVLQQLAPIVAERLGALETKEREGIGPRSAELAETFAVWRLPHESLQKYPREALNTVAIETGRWHHQIRSGNASAFAFARSRRSTTDPDAWRVAEVFVSPLAERIDEAIYWIDANIKEDATARLLVVPTLQLHAFWLHEEDSDRVVVVDSPPQTSAPQRLTLYQASDFLGICSQLPLIRGLSSL